MRSKKPKLKIKKIEQYTELRKQIMNKGKALIKHTSKWQKATYESIKAYEGISGVIGYDQYSFSQKYTKLKKNVTNQLQEMVDTSVTHENEELAAIINRRPSKEKNRLLEEFRQKLLDEFIKVLEQEIKSFMENWFLLIEHNILLQ